MELVDGHGGLCHAVVAGDFELELERRGAVLRGSLQACRLLRGSVAIFQGCNGWQVMPSNREASAHQLAKKMHDCAGDMLGGELRLLVELLRPPIGLSRVHQLGGRVDADDGLVPGPEHILFR